MKLTPGQAIRKNCIDCVGLADYVQDCMGDQLFTVPCPFYPYRMGKGRPSVKVIRGNCLWCMGGSATKVKECANVKCFFHDFRMGKNPAYRINQERRSSKKRTNTKASKTNNKKECK